ncbi:TetR/AcrR family transcriptional regulator [Dietzia sp.]|uniref:TetR/AcrR family transcriptional regulator n=1 Tax=Dietzia sp. TaxID=1871616 RepID=UPI002FDA4E1C
MAYHHGDLRRTLLDEAASAIADDGLAALSLRALAKRAGVSNAAPNYHFGDRSGLLTALATEGFDRLAAAMDHLAAQGDDAPKNASSGLVDMGVAYVDVTLSNPSHFAVMFQTALLRADDPALLDAQQRAYAALRDGVSRALDASGTRTAAAAADGAEAKAEEDAVVAAWSLVHGYATLVIGGAVPDTDPRARARVIAKMLGLSAGES